MALWTLPSVRTYQKNGQIKSSTYVHSDSMQITHYIFFRLAVGSSMTVSLFFGKEEVQMQGQAVDIVSLAIRYIEDNLDSKLDLETVATALHYSKYHLHRIFTKIVGLTIHEYVQRRQLTEAAKLLVFSKRPIIEIALISGYESQQAFTSIFKAMYKMTPTDFRMAEEFYPLQLEIHLSKEPIKMDFTKEL